MENEKKEETKTDEVMARLYIREFDDKMITDIIELSLIEGKKEIYLVSHGGLASGATILIDLINQEPENYVIKVSEQIASASLLTIINVKCKVVDIATNMSFFTAYMHHKTSIEGRINREVKKLQDKTNADMYSKIEGVLTDKQKRHYKVCNFFHKYLPLTHHFLYEDLYLSREQMKELLGDRYEY